MNFNEYQEKAIKTALYPEKYKIIYPTIGLGDEAGEVMGKVKKWLRGDDGVEEITDARRDLIKGELGDVLWYLSALAHDLNIPLEDVALSNIEKLQSRKERNVLQGNGDSR